MLPFVLKTICEKEKKNILRSKMLIRKTKKEKIIGTRNNHWFNLLGSCYPPNVLIRLRGLFLPRIQNIPSIDRGSARHKNYIHQKIMPYWVRLKVGTPPLLKPVNVDPTFSLKYPDFMLWISFVTHNISFF